jgi:hypothetical protein
MNERIQINGVWYKAENPADVIPMGYRSRRVFPDGDYTVELLLDGKTCFGFYTRSDCWCVMIEPEAPITSDYGTQDRPVSPREVMYWRPLRAEKVDLLGNPWIPAPKFKTGDQVRFLSSNFTARVTMVTHNRNLNTYEYWLSMPDVLENELYQNETDVRKSKEII